MNILLTNVGKEFHNQFVIRNINHSFSTTDFIGIKGSNGSGKSTFLRLISSILTPSEGKVEYTTAQGNLSHEQARFEFSVSSPAMQLPPKMNIHDIFQFHFIYRKSINQLSTEEILNVSSLWAHKHKLYQELSSGLQQRVKLALACFSQSKFILLDEPTSNLDKEGIRWTHSIFEQYRLKRGIIIASNEERDFSNCNAIYSINQWKP